MNKIDKTAAFMFVVTILLFLTIAFQLSCMLSIKGLDERLDKLETIFENADYVTITENGSAEVN